MQGKDILNALNNDPDAIKYCHWEKISSFEWIVILKVRPELTNRIRDTLMQNQSLLEVLSLDRKILEKPQNWNLPVQKELFSPLLL